MFLVNILASVLYNNRHDLLNVYNFKFSILVEFIRRFRFITCFAQQLHLNHEKSLKLFFLKFSNFKNLKSYAQKWKKEPQVHFKNEIRNNMWRTFNWILKTHLNYFINWFDTNKAIKTQLHENAVSRVYPLYELAVSNNYLDWTFGRLS